MNKLKKFKKLAALVATTLLTTSLFAGCGNSNAGENGTINFKAKPGVYQYQELVAPDGYELDSTIYTFTVTKTGEVIFDNDTKGIIYDKKKEEYNNVSGISGIFKSFGDSPDGFKGELQEVMVSIGAEYSYNEQFFLRGGYFYENANKGNRQYFSVGAGFRMSVFQLDAAYLVSTVQSNPLDQTLRFTLSFDMDGIKNLFR